MAIITCLAEVNQALHLPAVALRIHFKNGNGEWFLFSIGIHTYDLADALINLALIAIRRVRDLAFEESHLDSGNDSTQIFDPLKIIVCLLFHSVSHCFNEEAASEWIDRVRHSRLFCDDLLGA